VRGGNSNYNKVIIDGVPVNDPGGIFDFGVSPLDGADRVELVRGAQSTLYGSEAMTSVVQVFTREGSTHVPELRVGADGGTFDTARGYALLAGARGLSITTSLASRRIRTAKALTMSIPAHPKVPTSAWF